MALEMYRPYLYNRKVANDGNGSDTGNADWLNQQDPQRHKTPQKKGRLLQMQRLPLFVAAGMLIIFYATIIYNSFLVVSRHNASDRGRDSHFSHRNPHLGGFSHAHEERAASNTPQQRKFHRAQYTWPRHKMLQKQQKQRKADVIIKPVDVLFEAPETLRLPKPIINVGFPKAGTSTIFSFFHCNGLKSQHWLCCEPQDNPTKTKKQKLMSRCILENLVTKSPIFDGCGDYDVYTEINGPRNFKNYHHRTLLEDGRLLTSLDSVSMKMRIFFPQHHQLEEIHKQHPNATLVLNKRSVESWIDSVLAWDKNLRYHILNEFYEQRSTRFLFDSETDGNTNRNRTRTRTRTHTHTRKHDPQHSEGNNNDDFHPSVQQMTPRRFRKTAPFTARTVRKHLETVHEYHLQYIRDWVAEHPSHALIEVDIASEDAGATLANAFGLKEECWGHYNKNDGRSDSQSIASSGGSGGGHDESRETNATRTPRRTKTQRKMVVSGRQAVPKHPFTASPVDPRAVVGGTEGRSNRFKHTRGQDGPAAAQRNRFQAQPAKTSETKSILNEEKFGKLGIEINITDILLKARAG